MTIKDLSKWEPHAYAALRIVAGFMFLWHGLSKVFGVLGTQQDFGTQAWIGGVIELVGGALIMLGLLTRGAAFIASGTMAVAYFQFHWKLDFSNYKFLPSQNHGELAALYCFVFLLIALRGPGMWSLDGARG